MSKPDYQCPRCGGVDLSVTVITSARLIQDDGNLETLTDDSDHEWDHLSVMYCHTCGWSDGAGSFYTGEER